MTQSPASTGLDIYWVNQFAVPPDQPGGTRHYDFAAELTRRGHRVRLIASDLNLTTRQYSRRRRGRDIRAIRETLDGVPFVWLTAGSYQGNDWRRVVSMLTFGFVSFLHLITARRSSNTVFIGSSPHLFAALGAWAAAKLRRVPFVFEVRDLWPESYSEVAGKTTGPEIKLMRWIADRLYRQASRIVVLAEPNIERIVIRGIDQAKIINVPNGVDLESMASGEPAADLGRPGAFTFVYAGAHGPANDLQTVVRACKVLEDRGRDDIHVSLLGDGPTKASLIDLASELDVTTVRFFEPVPKSAIGPTLGTADAGLMVLAPVDLFSYGVSPNKLFDYLGSGLPVLTNVSGLVTDIVRAADVGLSVEGGDPDALADGMIALADGPRIDAATRGRAFIEENYERRKLVLRIEELLRAVTATR